MTACDACLRRSHVIATLAARIEGLLQRPNGRISQLLALPSEQLLEALVPGERLAEVRGAVQSFEPARAPARPPEALLE
jgi:hypothetical protein